jgi:predicted transcriptional regulator
MRSKNRQTDDFGTFLESVQRAVKSDEEISGSSTLKLMNTLSRLGEVEVVELMTVVEMQWNDFSDGINTLQSAGLIQMAETRKGGKIQLTSDGLNWVNALTPSAEKKA